jgi:hypothetical protein
MKPADALPPGGRPRVLDELAVALVGRDLLLVRAARRVRARGRDEQTARPRALRRRAAQLRDPVDRLVRRVADLVGDLDDGCVQLRLQDARQRSALDAAEELLHAGRELERLAVEDPELLLDADREGSPEMLLDHRARTPCTGPPAASHA